MPAEPESSTEALNTQNTPQNNFENDNADEANQALSPREQSDIAPFAFTVAQLQKLIDPKDLEHLNNLGGVDALCRGLLVNPTTGLHPAESTPAETVRINPIVNGDVQELSQSDRRKSSASSLNSLCKPVPFEDRHRVYGKNYMEPSPPTSIWRLVMMAFSDKILVCFFLVFAYIDLLLNLHIIIVRYY
jgi:Ca2+-transporting ATPase